MFTGMIQYPAGAAFPIASLSRWVLDRIVKTYEEHAQEATALPERKLLTIGSVAVDSPLLAVMYGGSTNGPPGNELTAPLRADSPRSAAYSIELWRPIETSSPNGLSPAPDAVQSAYAEVVMQDAWLLMEAAASCDQMGVGVIASVAVNQPEGELVGCNMSLELQIP